MNETSLLRRNIYHLRFLLVIIFLMEAFFLLYVERIRLVNQAHNLIMVSYLLHLTLAVFSMSVFMFLFLLRKHPLLNNPSMTRIPFYTTFIVLILSSVIALFDQLTHGHITLFSVHLLGFGLLIYFKPYRHLVIFTVPFIIFLFGVITYQANVNIALTHFINTTIIYISVCFTSAIFYKRFNNEVAYKADIKKKNNTLTLLSTIDPLTRLPNRRFFARQINYESALNRRYKHESSLLLVDIDFFKKVNDTYGHAAGDMILSELATLFKNAIRESDTVCRWGGEEFMFLLSHTDVDGAKTLATRIRKMAEEQTFTFLSQPIQITISIGVTRLDHEQSDGFTKSYQRVDEALYIAKEQGRNSVVQK